MKISGSSKIISKKEDIKLDKQEIDKEEMEAQEELVSIAETSELLHTEVIEHNAKPKTKIDKIKESAKFALDKTKPLREKQKLIAKQAITKARELSPYVDKTITAIDTSIDYITKSEVSGDRSSVVQDTRPPAVFGIWIMIFTFGFFMMWAILAPLDSASNAVGKIVLDSKKRIIQHLEGGIIKEILVREGDKVQKGQTLVLLDDTQLRARKQVFEYKCLSSIAEIARLLSERDGLDRIVFPEKILSKIEDKEVVKMIKNQEKLFEARMNSLRSKQGIYQKMIAQSEEEKNSIMHQIESINKLYDIVNEQVASYKKLFANGNISKTILQDAESKKADYQGKKGTLLANLSSADQKIMQHSINLENIRDEYLERVNNELKQVHAQLSIDSEQLKEAESSLARTVIVAPEAGVVSNILETLTPRGTITQQQHLMEIIPQDDKLVIDAKIKAMDIASVKVGQTARVRLSAFRARVVPILEGKVISLSSDAIAPITQMDMQTSQGGYFYRARIEIDKDQLQKVAEMKDVFLYPGMQVDVMIIIGTRTMMKYLMDPITLTLDKSFREK
jgi:HlyD family secretion protein